MDGLTQLIGPHHLKLRTKKGNQKKQNKNKKIKIAWFTADEIKMMNF